MKLYKIFAGVKWLLRSLFRQASCALAVAFFMFIAGAYAFTIASYSFETVFTGFGTVEIDQAANTVDLTPMMATSPAETHAALVASYEILANVYEISMTVTNNAQLRQNSAPNPWEAPWIVFGYDTATDSLGNPDQTFTYLILKPNGYGLELGESLIDDGQNFLWTSTVGADSYNVGQSYDVTINVNGNVITVTIDGVEKFVFSNTAARTLSLNGKFGFYTEDADVTFSNINVQVLSNQGAVGFAGGVESHVPRHDRYVKRAYHRVKPEVPQHMALKQQIRNVRKEKQKEIAMRGELPNLNESALRFRERQKVKRR